MVVDCQKAQQNIELFVDGMLTENQQKQLMSHVQACARCQKALADARLLKQALSALGELEPPVGLTQSALKKVRRRSFYPYLSAAAGLAAAAVVLVAVLGTGSGGLGAPQPAPEMMDAVMFSADIEEDAAVQMAPAEGESYGLAIDDAEGGIETKATELPGERSRDFAGQAELTFETEQAFAAGFGQGYYRPAVLPEGAQIESIVDDGLSAVFHYRLESGGVFVFEWLYGADKQTRSELDENMLTDSGSYYFTQHEQLFRIYLSEGIDDIDSYAAAEWQP